MKRENLTATEKRRLEQNRICPICNHSIKDNDEIIIIIKKQRRCKIYTFYHEGCLINEQEEPATEKATT